MPHGIYLVVAALLVIIFFFILFSSRKVVLFNERFLVLISDNKRRRLKIMWLLPIAFIVFSGFSSLDLKKHSELLIALPFISDPWPDDIYYYNNSNYDTTLDLAISRWQKTGLPISFREASSREEADIILEDDKEMLEASCINKGCLGHARIGYTPLDWRENVVLLSPLTRKEIIKEKKAVNARHLQTVIHELGHVLGLGHNEDDCSLMNDHSFCRQNLNMKITSTGTLFSCGPYRDDLARIGELYNFTPREITPRCFDREASWKYYTALSQKE